MTLAMVTTNPRGKLEKINLLLSLLVMGSSLVKVDENAEGKGEFLDDPCRTDS